MSRRDVARVARTATNERGSVLMLMPAAVLVVVVLAAMAVDFAILFLGERELADVAAAAANDASTAGLERDAFYDCRGLILDPGRARAAAGAVVAARASDAVRITAVDVSIANDAARPQVTVDARGTVGLLFSTALPGAATTGTVQARAVAVAEPLGPGAGPGW